MRRAAWTGGLAGGVFAALFSLFYALGSWLICSGRTGCPGSWVPYMVIAVIMWTVITAVIASVVIAVFWFYRMTKV